MALTFKTEEEKLKALEAIPQDPPPFEKIEKWQEETIAKIEEINAATIDENFEPETPKENEDGTPIEKEEGEEDPAEARVREMTNRLAADRKKLEEERQEFLRKSKELEERLKNPPQPDRPDPNIEKKDLEISSVRKEIDEIEKAINVINDPSDPDYIRGINKKASLASKLVQISVERANMEIQRHNDEFKKLRESQEKDRLEKERLEKERKKVEKAEASRQIQIKEIDSLRNNPKYKSDFLSKAGYDKMEAEVNGFGRQCAAAYTGKSEDEVSEDEIEISVQRYLNKSPQLLEKLQEMKIKEPPNMREYLIMTDVFGLKEGIQLNKKTGKWEKIVDAYGSEVRFPTIDAAYEYYKQKHGITGKDLLNAEKKTAEGIVAAISKRANVKELNSAAQSTKNHGMDKETAEDILKKWDANEMVDLARNHKMNDPRLKVYNDALIALGQSPIDESW